jgi:hypothetical protein
VVLDRVTRFCLGGCAASFSLLVPVIDVGVVLDRVTRFCLGVDASFSFLAPVIVGAMGLAWLGVLFPVARDYCLFLFLIVCALSTHP